MNTQPFGLLELGSNSLKYYRVVPVPKEGFTIETHKFPWRIAHEYFARGVLEENTIREILDSLREVESTADLPIAGMLSLATGVFREFPDLVALTGRIKDETGVRLRVISGEDEAKLMAKTFRTTKKGPILLSDLGGASTEWAWIYGGRLRKWGSRRLGAIRSHCLLQGFAAQPSTYLQQSQELCDEQLKSLPVTPPATVLVTGGTAKALAGSRKKDVVGLDELRETIRDVQAHGPPEDLGPQRREVYLPGLIILERLVARCEAPVLEYARTSVREGMARRLVDLLGKRDARDLHSTLLLHTSSSG